MKINVLLLDIGGVVIKLNWKQIINKINTNNNHLNEVTIKKNFSKCNLISDFEIGKIDAMSFYKQFINKWKIEIDHNDFLLLWNSLLDYVYPELEPLLKEVSKSIPIYALSNTNIIHRDEFIDYSIFRQFEKLYLSHEIKLKKPNNECYEFVLKDINCPPENILFIDDTHINLDSAKKQGVQVAHSLDSVDNLKEIFKKFKILP